MSTPELLITYPPELPVSAMRDEIARVIAANQVVIVAGETGSGKTTQLPKILLELGVADGSATPSPGASPPAASPNASRANSASTSAESSATRCGSTTGRPATPA